LKGADHAPTGWQGLPSLLRPFNFLSGSGGKGACQYHAYLKDLELRQR
jgi:hypothetical protein